MEKTPVVIFSVSDFIATVNQTLEYAYPSVVIEGEVASFKVNQGKFVFFDLKDNGGSIGCFMTVWQLRAPIEDGMKVVVTATPKLTQWGKFSLTVRSVRPSGEGSLKKSFELLRTKLEKEGLFAVERKRLLPEIPQRIAVISSTQAAGYGDFIKLINERWGGLDVEVAHVQVQGSVAPDQIICALEYFNSREVPPEVLVIIRGGGSADDLSSFNDELLVRAVAGSRVPTLVGVGHEMDQSLCDLVADVSVATPSHAAQIIVPDRREIIRTTQRQVGSLLPRMEQVIDRHRAAVEQQLQDCLWSINQQADWRSSILSNLRSILAELDPQKVLARGYAIVRGDATPGDMISIEKSDKIITAEVRSVSKK
jgi:exodeoxyribonuclease VII large subunit